MFTMDQVLEKTNKKSLGFTIVELLIVIVVIGILAAIIITAYNGIQNRARISTLQADLRSAYTQLAMDQVANGVYPSTTALANGGAGLKASPGTTYQYSIDSSAQNYCITATNSNISFFSTNLNNVSQSGACPGQGANGSDALTNLATDPEATSWVSSAAQMGWKVGRWFGNGSPGGTGTYSLITNASDGPNGIKTYARKTWSTAAPNGNNNTGIDNSSRATAGVPITSSTNYTSSAFVRTNATGISNVHMRYAWYNSSGAMIGTEAVGPSYTLSPNTWIRISATMISPASAAFMYSATDVDGGTSWAAGNTYDATGLMLTASSSLYNFADGNSTNWIWNGTPNNSTSTGSPL